MKKILDACCGSKMFWFDKNNVLEKQICDLFELNDRLVGIGCRLNSISHPINSPKKEKGENEIIGTEPEPPQDGVLRDLESLKYDKAYRLNTIREELIPKMSENISYIERYI